MAWWGRWRWAPRRRWRRRRRRRRVPTRRYRRPRRRTRARRVRRRKWGRRRWRRGYRRRLRLRRRRRRKKKLVLTQWNPAKVRRCLIKGYIPLILCGAGRTSFNYAMHTEDNTMQKPVGQNPHGGGMSTTTFTLQVLYDQYQRYMNKWSYGNDQLDLARYRGCSFSFYRHQETDFIVQYDIVPPMKMDEYTSPNTHPNFLLQAKRRVLVYSFKTRPGGRKKVTVRVPPPKLFEDKWYSQHDLCQVHLVSWRATACNLRYPFCSPQTDNPCTTFQVLHEKYYDVFGNYGLTDPDGDMTQKIQNFETWLYGQCTHYQTFATESRLRPPGGTNPVQPDGTPYNSSFITKWRAAWNSFYTKRDSNYGWCNFDPNQFNPQKVTVQEIRDTKFSFLTSVGSTATQSQHVNTTFAKGKIKYHEYHLGWYSNVFIGSHRYNPQFRPAYIDITYNALNDKGDGNMIWFQYLTKPTTEFDAMQCKCVVTDIPLYAALYGYDDYVQRTLGKFTDTEQVGIVCVICKYTDPPLVRTALDKKKWGYIFYDTHFGNGKSPEGLGQIHTYWMQRWRPYMMFQRQVMNDICKCGPFSYRDDLPSTTLTARYKFYFNWGGDAVFPQIIKDPCPQTGQHLSHRERRSVQVVSPLTMGPEYIFHKWDWRRGFFNQKALKRMLEKSDDVDSSPTGPKFPRWVPPTDANLTQREDSTSEEASAQSSQEEKDQEVQEVPVQQYLLKQYKRQRELGKQIQFLMLQLTKTQTNLHMNPRALGLA
uniref:Capsid protein n=1 Tax=Alphatorquevirus homin18 TaxID=3048419 RepID=A0AAU8H446_9VIRU